MALGVLGPGGGGHLLGVEVDDLEGEGEVILVVLGEEVEGGQAVVAVGELDMVAERPAIEDVAVYIDGAAGGELEQAAGVWAAGFAGDDVGGELGDVDRVGFLAGLPGVGMYVVEGDGDHWFISFLTATAD